MKIILSSQHGFLPGKSCTTNLIEYIGAITKAIDEGLSLDAIMIDFRRAFDKVPFAKMLAQVKAHGIGGELLRWIENWTVGHRQRVVLNGEASEWADVTSSVVQGSVLGPILFLIYINTLDYSDSKPRH